jgi:hypothetical protein
VTDEHDVGCMGWHGANEFAFLVEIFLKKTRELGGKKY